MAPERNPVAPSAESSDQKTDSAFEQFQKPRRQTDSSTPALSWGVTRFGRFRHWFPTWASSGGLSAPQKRAVCLGTRHPRSKPKCLTYSAALAVDGDAEGASAAARVTLATCLLRDPVLGSCAERRWPGLFPQGDSACSQAKPWKAWGNPSFISCRGASLAFFRHVWGQEAWGEKEGQVRLALWPGRGSLLGPSAVNSLPAVSGTLVDTG